MKRTLLLAALPLAFFAASASAQEGTPKGTLEVRPIGAATVTSTDTITMLGGIRELPGGRLLVNDIVRRQLLLLDNNLKLVRVVADTAPGTPNPYGQRPGSLVAYRGDSSLFIDAASLSMLVIDGNGNIARVASVPRSADAMMMATTALGGLGFDGERLVYRGLGGIQMNATMRSNTGAASSGPSFGSPVIPDTMPIVRVNIATRAVDTAAYIKVSTPKTTISNVDGRFNIAIEINPLPVVDEYAVLSDGRVAVVRGRDYHVDFIEHSGAVTTGPKIPFEWKRLSDEEKVAFIDSVKAIAARQDSASGGSAMSRVASSLGGAFGGQVAAGAAGAAGGGGGTVVTRVAVGGSIGGGGGGGGAEPPRRVSTTSAIAPEVSYIEPSQLPDYQPPFFGNQARGDMDGNLWVRIIPPKPVAGGPVYDVINGKGELVERVQIPVDRTVAGFGKGGVVYLSYVDNGITKLERATFK